MGDLFQEFEAQKQIRIEGPVQTGEDLTQAFETAKLKRTLKKKPDYGQMFEDFAREEAPQFIGGTVGAAIGKTPSAARTGAFLGGAIGRGVTEADKIIFDREGKATTAGEFAKRVGIGGAEEFAGELGGQLITDIGGTILKPFTRKGEMRGVTHPEIEMVDDTISKYMPQEDSSIRLLSRLTRQKKPSTLPAEATEIRELDLLHNISESSIVGGRVIKKHQLVREEAIEKITDDIVTMYGNRATSEEVGEAIVSLAEDKWASQKAVAGTLYNSIDDAIGSTVENVPIIKEIPSNILDESGKPIINRITVNQRQLVPKVKFSTKPLKEQFERQILELQERGLAQDPALGDRLLKIIDDLPDEVGYGSIQKLRTLFRTTADEFAITNKKAPVIGMAKKLESLTDNVIEKTLTSDAPEWLPVWRQANNIYREGSEKFNNRFIKGLIKTVREQEAPEKVVGKIFTKNNVSAIKKIKTVVDDSTWRDLKDLYVQDVMKKATKDGDLNAVTLSESLFGKTGLGESTLKEIFSPKELNILKNNIDTIKFIQTTSKRTLGEGIGRLAIQFTQIGAIVGLATSTGDPIVNATIVGGPLVLARMMTNPIFGRIVKEISVTKSVAKAGGLLGRLTRLGLETKAKMKEEGIEFEDVKRELKQRIPISNKSTLGE